MNHFVYKLAENSEKCPRPESFVSIGLFDQQSKI